MNEKEAKEIFYSILDEMNKELDEAFKLAKENGTWSMGLDANVRTIEKPIRDKYWKRVEELKNQIDKE